MRVRVALAASGLVLVLGSSCDGGDPTPTTLPTPPSSAVTTPSGTGSPSASATPTPAAPTLPAAARADTPAGAESFARFWLTTLDYASSTGDTQPFKKLGSCMSCAALAQAIDKLYASGGRAEGGRILITASSTIQHVRGRAALVRVGYDQEAGTEIRPDGSERTTPAGENLAFVFTLSRLASNWTVAKVQPVKEG